MVKKCLYCGRYFVPDRRVGAKQKACHREECKKARKREAQQGWCKKNPDYFKGDYWRVKEWRQNKRQCLRPPAKKQVGIQDKRQDMIQDEIPAAKPYQKLILLIPEDRTGMIQDEIRLRRVDETTFAAYGW